MTPSLSSVFTDAPLSRFRTACLGVARRGRLRTGVARVRVAAGTARLHYSLDTQACSAPRRPLAGATAQAMAGAGGR